LPARQLARTLSTFTRIDENIRRIDRGGGQGRSRETGVQKRNERTGLLNILCPGLANEYRVPPKPWYTYGYIFVYRYSTLSVPQTHCRKWVMSLSHFSFIILAVCQCTLFTWNKENTKNYLLLALFCTNLLSTFQPLLFHSTFRSSCSHHNSIK